MAARLWIRTLVFSSFRRHGSDVGELKSSFLTLINSPWSIKQAQFSVQTMTSCARAESGGATIQKEATTIGDRLSEEEILAKTQTDKKLMEAAVGNDVSLPGQDLTKEKVTTEPLGDPTGEERTGDGGDDKYLYMQRGFTSEIFKIEIRNIPKYISYSELKKKLEKLGLKPVKIKKPLHIQQKVPYCFVTFRSEEEREEALKVLEGQTWKKKAITAKVAAPAVDPLYRLKERKRGSCSGSGDNGSDVKRPRLDEADTHLTLQQRLDQAVTPLRDTPYETQLVTKAAAMRQALKEAAYLIQKENSNPGVRFAEQVKQNDGMMCLLKPILPSPLQAGYRNKAEFTVGLNEDKTPVVGFRLGSYGDGNFTVASPEKCVHIPDRMKDLCQVFQEFFRHSPLPPFVASDELGYWRQVAVRCYGTGESMAVVMIHPQKLTKEELASEKKRLVDFFTTGPGTQCRPNSLYFHTFARKEGTKEQGVDLEYLLGDKHVHENILGLKFRISPDAFFQTNSQGTEVLYRMVQEFCFQDNHSIAAATANSTSPPIIYDICCGTGTIGLYLAKALPARRVIGVEMNSQAVADARANAELNGIEGAEFVCGKAEDVLQKQLEECGPGDSEVIGVVDPPRAGLHPRVIQCIRRCSHIQKLVYVSCNPEGQKTLTNFIDLCRRPSLRVKGTPFVPVMAVPVDLFPHTPHCELVVLFQRSRTTLTPNHTSTRANINPNLPGDS